MKDKNITCDLHTHSVFSDGTFTPTEIIMEAKGLGLGAVALCDHNTVSGLPEFLSSAEEQGIEAVAGVEFSTVWDERELHIIGLFIKPEYFDAIEMLVEESHKLKEISNINLVRKLNENGYHIDYDEIKNLTPDGLVNRAHIAAKLTERGYTESINQAFKTIISKRYGFYKPPKKLASFEVIKFIRSIGAVPVLAHPFINMTADELEIFLSEAKQYGLAGMETRYSLYDEETVKLASLIAQKHGLLESGGSDFHGENKPSIKLGTGKGNLMIPYEFYKNLKELES